MREHFIDDFPKVKNIDVLVKKLDYMAKKSQDAMLKRYIEIHII